MCEKRTCIAVSYLCDMARDRMGTDLLGQIQKPSLNFQLDFDCSRFFTCKCESVSEAMGKLY